MRVKRANSIIEHGNTLNHSSIYRSNIVYTSFFQPSNKYFNFLPSFVVKSLRLSYYRKRSNSLFLGDD